MRRLSADLFTWVGFEDHAEKVRAMMDPLQVHDGLPDLIELDNVTIIPPMSDGRNRPRGPQSGVLDESGAVVEAAFLTRGDGELIRHLDDAPKVTVTDVIDEPVIFLGWLFEMFGHVLLESLARMWALSQVDHDFKVVYLGTSAPAPTSWRGSILALHGIRIDRLLTPQYPVKIRKLIIPSPGFVIRKQFSTPMANLYAEVAERIVGATPVSDQPLYLSRSLVRNDKRHVSNELDLEEVLRDNGFLVVNPETLPIHEQIRLVNQHRVIVGLQGSAFHTMLYSRFRPHQVLITQSSDLNGNYPLVSELVESPTTFVNAIREQTATKALRPVKSRSIDTEAVLGYLIDEGLVRNHGSAASWRPLPVVSPSVNT